MTGGSSCDDGNFYPRSPCGERRSNQPVTMRTWKFLSTLSLRRATQAANGLANAPPEISIHALLAESDTRRTYHKDESQEFLSTLSLRRATGILAISLRIVFAEFLSTLSLRRATAFSFALLYSTTISIHALLAESDPRSSPSASMMALFLSTLSLRRATSKLHKNICVWGFLSTLSLRRATTTATHTTTASKFLSTLSLRRATAADAEANAAADAQISIHALLAESDDQLKAKQQELTAFLSTLSLRRATVVLFVHFCDIAISIHALLAESDKVPQILGLVSGISIHALLAESDPQNRWSF